MKEGQGKGDEISIMVRYFTRDKSFSKDFSINRLFSKMRDFAEKNDLIFEDDICFSRFENEEGIDEFLLDLEKYESLSEMLSEEEKRFCKDYNFYVGNNGTGTKYGQNTYVLNKTKESGEKTNVIRAIFGEPFDKEFKKTYNAPDNLPERLEEISYFGFVEHQGFDMDISVFRVALKDKDNKLGCPEFSKDSNWDKRISNKIYDLNNYSSYVHSNSLYLGKLVDNKGVPIRINQLDFDSTEDEELGALICIDETQKHDSAMRRSYITGCLVFPAKYLSELEDKVKNDPLEFLDVARVMGKDVYHGEIKPISEKDDFTLYTAYLDEMKISIM